MMNLSKCLRHRNNWNNADHRNDISQLNLLLKKYGLRVDDYTDAPTITTYKVNLNVDTKINAVMRLENNFAIAVNDQNVRIEQRGNQLLIQKRGANNEVIIEDLCNDRFLSTPKDKLLMMLGIDTDGIKIYYDLKKAPHMIVSGTTGSGKSIFLHQILVSLIINHPHDIDYMGIDPKGNEFRMYSALKNFTFINDTVTAIQHLKKLVDDMEMRYDILARANCRDIESYNANGGRMRHKVCVIDEFADLMLTGGAQVEDYTVRLAQKARACGIHLIIATQSPRRDVITGLIAANIPTRVALSVTDQVESRVALGRKGAEKLNGRGDALLLANGQREPIRIQGANVTEEERNAIIYSAYLEQNPNIKPAAGWR